MGTGDSAPVHPSDPAALRALAAYERHLDAVAAAPWRYDAYDRAEEERAAAAALGRDAAAWAMPRDPWAGYSPAERAALEHDAALFRLAADPLPPAASTSLDTWEHLHTSNSAPAPANRAPIPPGQDETAGAERVRRYDRAKGELGYALHAAADALADTDYEAPGPAMLERMARAVAICRDVRAFRDAGCGAILARPFSCDVRLCPDCERTRSAAYGRRVAGLAAEMRRPVFGTLTIPNVPAGELGRGVDIILDAWGRIRRTALFAGGACRNAHQHPDDRPDRTVDELPPRRARCKHAPHREPGARACASCGTRAAAHERTGCTFTPRACACARCMRGGKGCRRCLHAPVAGGVAALEVTYNAAAGTWHPHLHFVGDAPWIGWRELRDAWRAASCDATRAAAARPASRRGAGYRTPEHRPRVNLDRCRHLADAQGRPAELVCLDGHGWRAADGERCPYRDRENGAPCGMPGELVAVPCAGASVTWIQAARSKDGAPAGPAAVREAVKYATKGLVGKDGALVPAVAASPVLLAELLLVLRARRLVNGWGTFHGITDDPEDADAPELVAIEIGEFRPVKVPKLCPACGLEGLWEHLGVRARADCVPGAGGRLYWRPPDPGGPH